MRLFAAIRPPDEVLDHLETALGAVAADPAARVGAHRDPVRWTARETWHVTVAFYGEVPDGAVDDLTDRLARTAAEVDPFTLVLRGSGMFAGRTLWIGVGGEVAVGTALAERAVLLGQEVTGRRDERVRSRLHLTFGRVTDRGRGAVHRRSARAGARHGGAAAGAGGAAAGLVRALAVYEGPAWRVRELRLVASRPGEGRSGGPAYTDVDVLPLGPAG